MKSFLFARVKSDSILRDLASFFLLSLKLEPSCCLLRLPLVLLLMFGSSTANFTVIFLILIQKLQFQLTDSFYSSSKSSVHSQTSESSPATMSAAPSNGSWCVGDADQEDVARKELEIWPLDEGNVKLLNQVHPRSYQSTEKPHETYDLRSNCHWSGSWRIGQSQADWSTWCEISHDL